MVQSNTHSHEILQRYGLAVVSVVLALLPALLLQHYNFHDVELPLLPPESVKK